MEVMTLPKPLGAEKCRCIGDRRMFFTLVTPQFLGLRLGSGPLEFASYVTSMAMRKARFERWGKH